MRADAVARLLALEAVVDAEVGLLLEAPAERPRPAMVARLGAQVEEIDRVDPVAAARAYDALVDFLAALPDEGGADAVVEAAVSFRRALDRAVERAFGGRDPADPALWAGVLDELLGALLRADAPLARALVHRARAAAERMTAAERPAHRAEVRSAMDRLAFAVLHRAAPVDALVHEAQRLARRRRPSSLARMGAYVVAQMARRRAVRPEA